jgi:diguanylate cyclase (GGDEF)-like protein
MLEPPKIILIVDDIPDNLNLLSDMLCQEGCVIKKATSSDMAFQLIEQQLPDLILLDIQMPKMDGYEICRQLKAGNKTKEIPIIFISAFNEMMDKLKAFSLGAVDYITKPFDLPEVLARVNNQLNIRALQKALDQRNQELKQAITDLEMALLESAKLRHNLECANQELRTANKKLGKLAIIDDLTQIPNRRRFDEYLDKMWQLCLANQEPISLILGDIDCFKLYNDHYGHQMGDRCLYAVAQALNRSVILSRDLVARYGGEEIAVILPNVQIDEAIIVAERILFEVRSLGIKHAVSVVKDTISVSLGVHSLVPTKQMKIGRFITECDQALYFSKDHGRDRLTVYAEIKDSNLGRYQPK